MTHGQQPGSQRLASSIARIRARRAKPSTLGQPPPMELKPTNAFEIAVAEQIKAMRQDLDRLEARLWWLFALILGAAVANMVLSLLEA